MGEEVNRLADKMEAIRIALIIQPFKALLKLVEHLHALHEILGRVGVLL